MTSNPTLALTAPALQDELQRLSSPAYAAQMQGYFKTGPGQYGEGDRFRGLRMPVMRQFARQHRSLSMDETLRLLTSPWHEDRMVALLILTHHYKGRDVARKASVYGQYLAHTAYINNWDLVDTSAPHIVGVHLYKRSRAPLYTLAASESLWERRIAIIATFHFIRKGQFHDTLALAEALLLDEHDLIHKAVGWMLREVGKKTHGVAEDFLRAHYRQMPRTMLRYAIERFPEALRQQFLRGLV